ncbi:MAG: acetyl-CoA carboxylase biotin carboxylase subunit [Candidatus Latescibacteria bacterium]|nr:acetyl-CoA carboxylase biotin carboxylase subunit [Candidatus Latescibacterota bacterium]NIM20961.1 acetyl-CoA carboxylase biotin carboxylase subunit [Candidatus Latescibacterota bacterium]NIM65096.1 acetyl-CoA carboxylase biotin carboxylase subunit [Candidatus Latescibacterota bacterium]NIO01611.1 acetyl-CoA carboxylase biotin carboxylase subunit [Candidatus Latescibacterota bacterium]NIO28128.1 acetyl-CoA carboxylase biotin carboxylase subunit [Candidatus Latescibacterota bacterium]
MFKKILIANRGEIALRIIRACRELGVETVAVHSEADTESLHVKFADHSVCIGKNPTSESYLNVNRLIAAAEVTGSEALHPGYGFLAENPEFAEVCESCDIRWIGPSSGLISQMGNKSLAKQMMHEARIPVIPGSDGPVEGEEEALQQAEEIGYPVMIKAAAGGGGKGMRIADNPQALSSNLLIARAEAESAFGNPSLYLERFLPNPRHVEVQLIGDAFGQIVHLGERDCSVQRRHQKLIEESPCAGITDDLRQEILQAAVKGAAAMEYHSVGTMEFLVQNDEFFFMEMNTRIQVEHPVTEMVTGRDLIKEQIAVAAGQKLSFTQDDILFTGHAIECRINSEDPARNFLPCPGKIDFFHLPGGMGVRVDSHVYQGYEISPYYDSMIAKIICHALDRNEAIQRMIRALEEFVIEGVESTLDFHQAILNDARFLRGEVSTRFLEDFVWNGQ